MSIEKVRGYFRTLGIEEKIKEFSVSSATVALAAEALGVEEARIAKSLTFKIEDRTILIVAAGDAKVDNTRYKAAFGGKAKMLTAEEAVERVGHAVGGVCPFAVNQGVEVYLDVSLRRFATVFPAAGSANSAIELSCAQLEQYACGFQGWGDFCKGWQSED